jgi:hypothetical protein
MPAKAGMTFTGIGLKKQTSRMQSGGADLILSGSVALK